MSVEEQNSQERYGIYFIPPAENPLYQMGSAILGYDIRAERVIHSSCPASGWTHFGSAHYFGFHATLRGTFKSLHIGEVTKKMKQIAQMNEAFILQSGYLDSFGEHDRGIRFHLDGPTQEKLKCLHRQLVDVVDQHRLFNDISPETQAIISTLDEQDLRLLQLHGDPRVLDKFQIHFSLANKASPAQLQELQEWLNTMWPQEGVSVLLDRLCLVRQRAGDSYWSLMEEYRFSMADF